MCLCVCAWVTSPCAPNGIKAVPLTVINPRKHSFIILDPPFHQWLLVFDYMMSIPLYQCTIFSLNFSPLMASQVIFTFLSPASFLPHTPPVLFLRPSVLACDYTQKELVRARDGRLWRCSLRWVFIKIGAVLVFPCTKTAIHSVSSLQGPFVWGTMYSVHCDLRFYNEVQLWHLSRSCVCVSHRRKGYFRMFNLLFLT